jgi:hypothetical protein
LTPIERELARELAKRSSDPLAFVIFAFPWGVAGTELEFEAGPDEWQREVLADVRDGLSPHQAIREAVASGHGIGKSALVAWLILWALCTATDARGVVTANTEAQLRTKTWAELAKWYRRLICKHWFQFDATAIYAKDPERAKTWRIDMAPWSERNTEAFAGLHNQGRRILVIYDEASAIPDVIWETTEGALTDRDTEILWFAFGNPTRNTGRFRECFGRFRHIWKTRQIDSRNTRITNKDQLAEWVRDYGEDSDFVRVRVRGVFPRAGSMQFIGADVVDDAVSSERDAYVGLYDAVAMGVDVARFGDDQSVIRIRRGRDARSIKPIKLRGVDTMTLAARIVDEAHQYAVDAIFVDGGGVGGGVVDRLRMLRMPVHEVQFGSKADRAVNNEGIIYANKRAEMWGAMRDWLKTGMIDGDPELRSDLTGIEYGYVAREGQDAIILEKKEDMKKRGLASPDNADALALTFAYPIERSNHKERLEDAYGKIAKHKIAYDPMAEMWNRRS